MTPPSPICDFSVVSRQKRTRKSSRGWAPVGHLEPKSDGAWDGAIRDARHHNNRNQSLFRRYQHIITIHMQVKNKNNKTRNIAWTKQKKKASPAIVVSKIIVHPMTDCCSSFVQALCKYIYIILWWQGDTHHIFTISHTSVEIVTSSSKKYSRKGRDLYSWINICLWRVQVPFCRHQ